jgi:hypothetical protein
LGNYKRFFFFTVFMNEDILHVLCEKRPVSMRHGLIMDMIKSRTTLVKLPLRFMSSGVTGAILLQLKNYVDSTLSYSILRGDTSPAEFEILRRWLNAIYNPEKEMDAAVDTGLKKIDDIWFPLEAMHILPVDLKPLYCMYSFSPEGLHPALVLQDIESRSLYAFGKLLRHGVLLPMEVNWLLQNASKLLGYIGFSQFFFNETLRDNFWEEIEKAVAQNSFVQLE